MTVCEGEWVAVFVKLNVLQCLWVLKNPAQVNLDRRNRVLLISNSRIT